LIWIFLEDSLEEVDESEDVWVLGKGLCAKDPAYAVLQEALNKRNLMQKSISSPEWGRSSP